MLLGPRTEDELFEEIREACRTIGLIPPKGTRPAPGYGFLYHTRDSRRSTAGLPDIFLLNRYGRRMWREEKRDGELLSPEQEIVFNLLRAGGEDVGVWRPADWRSRRIQHELANFRLLRPAHQPGATA